MKIALDTTPIDPSVLSLHKVRGVGRYIGLLKDNLEKIDKKNNYIFFSRGQKLPDDVDVIHYPYFEPFFLSLPFHNKKKTIITIHDLTPVIFSKNFPTGIKGKLKWNIERKIAKKAHAIVTDSLCSKKDIMRLIGVEEKKVHVAYLGVEDNFKEKNISQTEIDLLQKKYHLPEKFALYVGDATWNKNLPRIIKASIEAQIPLVLVGKTIAEKSIDTANAWNKDLIKAKELIASSDNVISLGFVAQDELVKLYNLAQFLLMPSLYEGFGLPVLEAMQSGCPVIVSNEGSLREVAGKAGMYVDPYNTQSIVGAMKELFIDDKKHQDMRKAGLEQAEKFSINKMIQDTVNVYKTLSSHEEAR